MIEIIQNPAEEIIAFYVLACAESLLGNIDEALIALDKSIGAGFNELSKMKDEKHFANIRNTDGFSKLIEKMDDKHLPNETNHLSTNEPPVVEKSEKLERSSNDTNVNQIQELKAKLDFLGDKFLMALPKSFLQDMLNDCQGDVDRVVSLINSTMFI